MNIIQEPILLINMVESIRIKGPRKHSKKSGKNIIGSDRIIIKVKREAADDLIQFYSEKDCNNTIILKDFEDEKSFSYTITTWTDEDYENYDKKFNAIELDKSLLISKMMLYYYNTTIITHFSDNITKSNQKILSEKELLSDILNRCAFIDRDNYNALFQTIQNTISFLTLSKTFNYK